MLSGDEVMSTHQRNHGRAHMSLVAQRGVPPSLAKLAGLGNGSDDGSGNSGSAGHSDSDDSSEESLNLEKFAMQQESECLWASLAHIGGDDDDDSDSPSPEASS